MLHSHYIVIAPRIPMRGVCVRLLRLVTLLTVLQAAYVLFEICGPHWAICVMKGRTEIG